MEVCAVLLSIDIPGTKALPGTRGKKSEGRVPDSVQRRNSVGPGLDRGADGVVLVGRDPDGLSGEGDVVVVAGGIVAVLVKVLGGG
jgi:hypothetical protein